MQLITTGRHFAEQIAQSFAFALVDAPEELGRMTFYMLWHDCKHHSPAHAWLRRTIRSVAAGLRALDPAPAFLQPSAASPLRIGLVVETGAETPTDPARARRPWKRPGASWSGLGTASSRWISERSRPPHAPAGASSPASPPSTSPNARPARASTCRSRRR
ncbi:hypothetical protein [Methylobacterium dankookense]|uniref:hypothetical protein n=1 Tax=Methylobacterium dankookense TaxID=560405 RepID=UPI001643BDD3|nr:hypothetical protein [Methylobacterium dankookense]